MKIPYSGMGRSLLPGFLDKQAWRDQNLRANTTATDDNIRKITKRAKKHG